MEDKQLQELRHKAHLIKTSPDLIKTANSINEVYKLIEQVNGAVTTFYRQISCKNKCFLCCQHNNVPTATSLEWQNLYEHILKKDDSEKEKLINSVKSLFSTYGSDLKRIHFALDSEDDDFKLKELYASLPSFKGTSCIFLKKGSCSVYESRPAKCRTQGFSLMQFQDNVQFQTCVPEIIRMEETFEQSGDRRVLMPVWNDYEQQIYSLHQEQKLIVTILPVWLFVHIENDVFVDSFIPEPDFEKLLSAF